jgi:hypothetical protein
MCCEGVRVRVKVETNKQQDLHHEQQFDGRHLHLHLHMQRHTITGGNASQSKSIHKYLVVVYVPQSVVNDTIQHLNMSQRSSFTGRGKIVRDIGHRFEASC